ncbi:uncharacterized protein LOC119661532 isoform X2 [Hermetia illucens]|uniref:uncharacterized protein LOC119661532 isoform X2 n=1 Tax=Hermetia illucens TaxID=343691 RepID=UPI0018CC4586|nr:uncharacterized protein LOC119661532 isoform X2 [Hermetia illucens]
MPEKPRGRSSEALLQHFKALVRRVRLLQRSLKAMGGSKFTRSMLSIDPYSENKVALLRAALLLNVITRYRNELKILMITVPVHVFPPWTLFSWSLQQFRNRMATDIPSYLDAFEANSDEVKNMAKINAELATLIGIGNFFIEDILGFGVDFSDSMIAIRNMKSLLHIENQYFKEYQEKSKTLSWMYEKLESYDLIVTGERSFSSNHMRMNFEEDDSDLEEDIINHWTNTEVENRYRRAYLKLQKKQIEQKTQNAEDLLLTNISNYIYKYQNEESAFRSIKHVNQNIINRIQDEILVITNKYDYESEKLDIERSRKKTQIGELKRKRLIMEERLAEMREEIGADRLRPIVKPTVHSVLDKLIEARKIKQKQVPPKKSKKGRKKIK